MICSILIVRSDWLMATNSLSARSAEDLPAADALRVDQKEKGALRRAGKRQLAGNGGVERGTQIRPGRRLVWRQRGRGGQSAASPEPVGDRRQAAVALGEPGLAFEQLADLGFHQLLVEHLPAGDAVDLRAQRRDAVLIGLLQACLPRRRGVDQIVPEHQIGGREQGSRCAIAAKAEPASRRQPRPDLEMTDIVAARDDDRVRFSAPAEDG